MTDDEAQGFIDNFLKEMFPKWEPTDWQLKQWYNTLKRCEYAGSKRRMESWYAETTRPGRGPILGIFNAVSVSEPRDESKDDPVPIFALARPDNFEQQMRFFWSRPPLPSPGICEAMSERYRERASALYCIDFVVVRFWDAEESDLAHVQPEFEGME